MPTHPKKPHHVPPGQEPGYTDQAAEECHDLIDRAEEEAHLHDPDSMYSTQAKGEPPHLLKKGGVEGTSGTQSSQSTGVGGKLQESAKKVTSTAGEAMGQMKDKMGLNK